MEQAAQIATGMNIDVLKEPRGFIRLIQFILAIFAFATTTSHSTSVEFTINCNASTEKYTGKIEYAYRLYDVKFEISECGAENKTQTVAMYGNFASSAEFYVFVGVMAFLYTIASVVMYVFFDAKYRDSEKIPIIDFIVTGTFALLWLISSSAWAQGVSDVKYYSNPQELFLQRIAVCSADADAECILDSAGNFASLIVSLMFGFLNMGVWAANLWFLFKETKWFQDKVPGGTQNNI